jgi:hypothetical protein
MRLNREAKVPMGWVEKVPLLWKLVADLGAVAAAVAAVVAWTISLGRDDVTMEWEAKGVNRPGLRRAYRISLPAAW